MNATSERPVKVRITDVRKVFRIEKDKELAALKNVTFDLHEQEFAAVVGASGCGKSTLLKIIAGILPATSGSVLLDGKAVEGPREGIGMIFQHPVLLQWRKILGNVMLPIEVGRLSKQEYHGKALELLELVGLKGFEDRYPGELSGGMQQRACICRALIHDPSLLLMDEPFGALDALTREQMNLELLRIWEAKKKTIILVTHSIPEAVFLADRVLVMTPRPGTVASEVKIDLPRPRTLDIQGTDRYGKYLLEIRHKFEALQAAAPQASKP